MPDSNFEQWRTKTVDELAAAPSIALNPSQMERHRIYSLALMAITYHYWSGSKYGRRLQYPLNDLKYPANIIEDPGKLGDDYAGHNIAALAVDGDGFIIDFEFNHNEVFNSSVEHAESRLLRRLFGLTQIQDSWNVDRSTFDANRYGTLLSNVSLYTTLESCAQCSGIMALATLKEVIYLQTDPGQYSIGNIMRRMTSGTKGQAPEPIAASCFEFPYFKALNDAYAEFRTRPNDDDHAMVLDLAGKRTKDSFTTSITSFLCTKKARKIYSDASEELRKLQLQYSTTLADLPKTTPLTTTGALREALQFVQYATVEGNRGTPHRT